MKNPFKPAFVFNSDFFIMNNYFMAITHLVSARSTSKRLKREYQVFKESGSDDKYELIKYFWVKDIIDNHQKLN